MYINSNSFNFVSAIRASAWSVLLVALFASPGLSGAAQRGRSDYARRIGVAESNVKNGLCININEAVPAGTRITIVWVDGRQSVTYALVTDALPGGCAMHVDSAQYSFGLKHVSGALPENAIGIAIVDPAGRARVRHGRAEMDVDGDGRLEQFRICTSHEGLHLTVWTGRALHGIRRWHQYYSLGYDVSPSCTGKDYDDT